MWQSLFHIPIFMTKCLIMSHYIIIRKFIIFRILCDIFTPWKFPVSSRVQATWLSLVGQQKCSSWCCETFPSAWERGRSLSRHHWNVERSDLVQQHLCTESTRLSTSCFLVIRRCFPRCLSHCDRHGGDVTSSDALLRRVVFEHAQDGKRRIKTRFSPALVWQTQRRPFLLRLLCDWRNQTLNAGVETLCTTDWFGSVGK